MSVHDHPAPFWTLVLRGGYDDLLLCPVCKGRAGKRGLCGFACISNPCLRYGRDCSGCDGAGEGRMSIEPYFSDGQITLYLGAQLPEPRP